MEKSNKKELILFEGADLPFETDFDYPPTLSRGVTTENFVSFNGVNCLFDWFSFTFNYTHDALMGILHLLDIDTMAYTEIKGCFYVQYTYKRVYENCISFYFPSDYLENKYDCRCLIELSGQACRLIESKCGFKTWLDFMRYIDGLKANCSRIDLAIDDFKCEFFTLKDIMLKVMNGEYVSDAISYSFINSGRRLSNGSGVDDGLTIYIGKRDSNRELCMYDKCAERSKADMEVFVEHWNRFELRHRHETAQSMFRMILNNPSIFDNFSEFVSRMLLGFVEFKEKIIYVGDDRNKTPIWKPWSDFIGYTSKIKVYNQSKIESSISKKKSWYRENYSNFMNEIALSDQSGFNQYIELTLLERLNDFDFDMKRINRINEYRKLKGQEKLGYLEFISYINNLRYKNNLPLLNEGEMKKWKNMLFSDGKSIDVGE